MTSGGRGGFARGWAEYRGACARMMASWWGKEKGGVALSPCKACNTVKGRARDIVDIESILDWERRYDAHPLVRVIRLERGLETRSPDRALPERWRGMMRRALAELGPRPQR